MYNNNDEELLNKLRSIVGPCGSSCILSNGGGSLQVTRDGHQILLACRNNDLSSNNVNRILLKLCLNVGDKYGDGTICTVLMLDLLLKQTVNVNHTKRIRLLQSYEVILNVFNCNKDKITQYLVNSTIWKSVPSTLDNNNIDEVSGLKGLLLNLLHPATNSKLANILLDVITNWLNLCNDGNTLSKCYYAISNFDELIVYSESASSSGQVSDSYALPLDSLMIENARCKDLSKLRKSSDKLYLFICIHSLLMKSNDDRKTTVSLTSLSSLSSQTSHRLLYVRTLISYMKDNNISVLVSCEEVDDDVYHALTISEIVVIDRVPLSYLQRLAETSKTVVWTNISDLQRHIYDTNYDEKVHTYGIFDNVVMIKTGKFTSHLFIRGIGSSRNIGNVSNRVSQLYLVCTTASMGMLTRLIKRCLKHIITAFNTDKTFVITPGAGAAEIEWSKLFQKISEALGRDSCHTINTVDMSKDLLSDFIIEKIKLYTEQKYNKLLFNDISNVCCHISQAYKEMPMNIINNSQRNIITIRNSNINRTLLEWSNCDSPVPGYVINNDDEMIKSGLLYSFHSNFNPDNLVISSASLFWYSFSTIIEAMRLYLRTGGNITNIKSKTDKTSDINFVNDESD